MPSRLLEFALHSQHDRELNWGVLIVFCLNPRLLEAAQTRKCHSKPPLLARAVLTHRQTQNSCPLLWLQGEVLVFVPSASMPHPTWQCSLSAGWGSCTAHAKGCCQSLRGGPGGQHPAVVLCFPSSGNLLLSCLSVISLSLLSCRARLEAFSDHSGKLQVPLQEIIDWLGQKDEELSAQLPLRGDVLLVQQEKETHAVRSSHCPAHCWDGQPCLAPCLLSLPMTQDRPL